jgi:hypothetical protein
MAPEGKRRRAVEETKRDLAVLMTRTASAGYSLVPNKDPRPAVNPLEKTFGHVVVQPITLQEPPT